MRKYVIWNQTLNQFWKEREDYWNRVDDNDIGHWTNQYYATRYTNLDDVPNYMSNINGDLIMVTILF
jgi:hypothetical protein